MTDYFLKICKTIGVPVAMVKTEWGTDIITFLGLLLNGNNFTVTVPEDKRIQTVNMIEAILSKKKAPIKELERLARTLNFLGRAIYPGRAFTRRMYSKFTGTIMSGKKYHHVKLDEEFKSDCRVWL